MLSSHETVALALSAFVFTFHHGQEHISSWASLNNLRLNTSKSKEMVIRRRSRFTCTCIPPQSIEGVERVKTMKVLGVVLSEDLSAATHISGVLESCSRSLYALRILLSDCPLADSTVTKWGKKLAHRLIKYNML